MTASINWNLVSAYMKGTNWYRAGIFNAFNPWSGSYGSFNADGSWTVGPMVWASAHTTQFSAPHSWSYLRVDPATGGAGKLANGGSYVTLKNFATGDFSIVIEKMSRDHSSCVRPGLPGYATSDEVATFTLAGALASVTQLQIWYTHWAYYPGDKTVEFVKLAPVAVVNGVFSLNITVDSLYTLTTLTTGSKGSFGAPPPVPTLFPEAHTDDFEACPISSEAAYFTDQNGIWECEPSNDPAHGTIMRQKVPLKPVTWGGDIRPHSLIGHRDGKDSSLVFDAFIEEPGASVMLGLRMQGTDNSNGILFAIDTTSVWGVWGSISAVGGAPIASGTSPVAVAAGAWHSYRGDVNGTMLNVWIDGTPVISNWDVVVHGLTTSGHALIGTKNYGEYTQFDNFELYTRYTVCGGGALAAGAPVGVVVCAAEVGVVAGSQWVFTAVPNQPGSNSTIALASNPALCVAVGAQSALVLAACNAADAAQLFTWTFDGIAPDGERGSYITNLGTGSVLTVANGVPDVGAQMVVAPKSGHGGQAFFFDFTAGEIANEATSTCLGVC
jgi:galactosylceramidase